MTLRHCAVCGSEFDAVAARVNAKLCSNKCRYIYQGLTRKGEANGRWQGSDREKKCEHCGKPFRCYTATRKFCSKACGVAGQKRLYGPANPQYNPDASRHARGNWASQQAKWSAQIIARDGAKCTQCGATGIELHAHHLLSWKSNPLHRFDLSNGVTLCYICHWNVHSQQQRKNSVNSVDTLTGGAEGNTEPSASRKIREGVTASGRAYRRVDASCEWCSKPISRSFGHVKGRAHLFCCKSCAAKFHHRARAVIAAKSAGRESDDIA